MRHRRRCRNAIHTGAMPRPARRTLPTALLPALLAILGVLGAASAVAAADLHVHHKDGKDTQPGTKEQPFATIQHAVNVAKPGDVIHLHPRGAVYRQSVQFRNKKKITLEGNGVTLDGADPLPTTGWTDFGDQLLHRKVPRTPWDRQLLIVDGVMERMGRTQSKNAPPFPHYSKLKPGQFTYMFNKTKPQPGEPHMDDLYVRGPIGKLTWSVRLNGVATAGKCEDLTIRNLHARYFLNDGFNIHGDCKRLRFFSITGYDCFDEGFSAHGTCEAEVTKGAFWGNENGVADVNSALTTYRHCTFQGNVNTDVLLIGKSHQLIDCQIINTTKAAALVAGPRTKDQPFALRMKDVTIMRRPPLKDVDRHDRPITTRMRVNGGELSIIDSVFRHVDFIPTGAKLTVKNLSVDGKAYKP